MNQESVTITGELQRVIWQHPDNGFMIGAILSDGQSVTVKGNVLNPQKGLVYKLTGQWVSDKKYGDQFQIKSFQTVQPVDPNAIYKYLVRVVKWVGSSTGNDLIDTFREKTLEVLKTDPGQVSDKIRGISYQKAVEIQGFLLANEINERVMVELWAMLDIPGMRKALPGELVERYQSNAAEVIKQNPYILTDFAGVSFPLADRVALNVGYAPDGIERKKAAVLYTMEQIGALQGDIWIARQELINKSVELANVQNIAAGIDELTAGGKLEEESGNYALIYLAENERYIAEKIMRMVQHG
ncbi:MAG: helix-hairpin-helix domain-containing protein [Smithella sp.]